MKKIGCIRCTTGAPAASIIATSRPAPRPTNLPEALARFLTGTTPTDLATVDLWRSLILARESEDHLLDIWFIARRYAAAGALQDVPEATAWAEAGLDLIDRAYDKMADFGDPNFAIQEIYLIEACHLPFPWEEARPRRSAVPANPYRPTARTPTPKEASPVC